MSIKKITIIGVSGNLGKLVLPELLKSDFNVTAVIRETSSAKFPSGIKVARSDFSVGSLTEVFKGQDAVVSMLPIVALGEQGVVIEAAIAAGVKRFLPSEYGSDTTNQAVIAAVPLFEGKKKYLDVLSSKEDVISWTALITGPFFDWTLPQGLTGFDLATKAVTLVDGGKTRFSTSNVAQIGRAFVAVLNHADETANKVVFVESFTTTQLEVLAAFEKITGEKWKVSEKKSEDIRGEGFKKLEEGNIFVGAGLIIQAAVLGKEALEDHTHVEGGIWNGRLGLAAENLEEEVERILHNPAF